MSDSKNKTTTSKSLEGKQPSFVCNSECLLHWRRIFLVRYFKELGFHATAEAKWQDFDVKMNVLSLKDEKQTFECTLPAKDLYKSVTEIKINRKMLKARWIKS